MLKPDFVKMGLRNFIWLCATLYYKYEDFTNAISSSIGAIAAFIKFADCKLPAHAIELLS